MEEQPTERQAPLYGYKDYDASSVLLPENLLREARRQKGLPPGRVPSVCALDPDGDVVRRLVGEGRASPSQEWACYHTTLYETELQGRPLGLVGYAVGAPFAVLVAEQLFASGCELLVSVTSAGQLARVGSPPYFVLIERALRDEGTSTHYAPASDFAEADPVLISEVERVLTAAGIRVTRGATWTTDAPYRETPRAIDAHSAAGLLAVEMEAAALYAFARTRHRQVVCFAHVTNTMAQQQGDFEKGEAEGTTATLQLLGTLIASVALRTSGAARGRLATAESPGP